MDSVLERINKNQFWKFPGGINPPEQKFLTNDKPIKNLRLPEELILPLKQHIGNTGELLIKVGDKVLKGQALTRSENPMSVPIHAPTSGTISAIKNSVIAHPSGMAELCIFLIPDGEERWVKRNIVENFYSLSKKQIVEKISDSGIAGMGGAGFPTSIKVNTSPGLNFLIINAAECEPYITADDLLIREHSSAIINGIDILDHLLEPKAILIGIEDNKPEAIAALQAASKKNDKIKVCVLPTKYPTGGEKQLIQSLTGQEVPSGVIPRSLGIVVQNVATIFAISEAIINDIPLLRRVVTVTGQALSKPQNVWALLGTPIEHLVEQCGFNQTEKQRVIMGGPLMGFSLPNLQVPVVKTTNCILAPTNAEISPAMKELECIRCGQCADVCPSSLLPQELQWQAKAKEYDELEKLNLFDCIECGACAYVCPSQIPLVQYYRVAKAEIRHNRVQDFKAERAKLRFEARKVRLEKEKVAREEKHQKALAARRAAAKTSEGQANNSAIAAALARVKAKKAQTGDTAMPDATDNADVKSRAAQAIERAKAKKLAQQSSANEVNIADDSKSKAAAAIARAKAKKLAKDKVANADKDSSDPIKASANTKASAETSTAETKLSASDEKKAKIKAAAAKAKAKKLAKEQTQQTDTDNTVPVKASANTEADTETSAAETSVSASDQKKAKIKAAAAKAKAKKLAKEQAQQTDTDNTVPVKASANTEADTETSAAETSVSASDEKKAKIKAAAAKAKAKKLAEEQAQQTDTDNTVPVKASADAGAGAGAGAGAETSTAEIKLSASDEKKAKIKAAASKAKAKKLAKEQAQQADKDNSAPVKASADADADAETSTAETKLSASDEKKAKIAKAIAKAKANKSSAKSTSTSISDDDKKKKISAAISKAKAKKSSPSINQEESE
ncbi:electron transport complex subunit RsxC [Thalassomonas sp. M1454]|uniref:electron transport complex subunit RsxC n=1 Tax=Thalassomonas sp. M1454 TaxID=2594477 RepID=UPI00117E80AD|nr:electron transport complex subunit RsxC [Thalassomonas sp. M1454]TRX56348.1 electron transport complex subunit RsxC [Thalassomonas sp. M1454]